MRPSIQHLLWVKVRPGGLSATSPFIPEYQTLDGAGRKAASGQTRTSAALFDHPIGTQQDGRRQFDADRLCSFEIHDRLEFARPLKRQVGRLRALYDLVDERCSAPK